MAHKYTLFIHPFNLEGDEKTGTVTGTVSQELINHYLSLEGKCTEDSGVDLFVPTDQTFQNNTVGSINHQICCFMKDNTTELTTGYYLYPRSSIYKYPLMTANSVGIIDAGYRGNIMAKVRCFQDETVIKANSKLFQLCAPDLSPLKVKVILSADEFAIHSSSKRGTNGFGSSGR